MKETRHEANPFFFHFFRTCTDIYAFAQNEESFVDFF